MRLHFLHFSFFLFFQFSFLFFFFFFCNRWNFQMLSYFFMGLYMFAPPINYHATGNCDIILWVLIDRAGCTWALYTDQSSDQRGRFVAINIEMQLKFILLLAGLATVITGNEFYCFKKCTRHKLSYKSKVLLPYALWKKKLNSFEWLQYKLGNKTFAVRLVNTSTSSIRTGDDIFNIYLGAHKNCL